ncbi:hypothetical protein DL771_003296 [Monosporascus sp. 5C6A]|nr:hypothetical protein DL771_003296 [Monosporascus sp. 5C6A]
MPTGERFPGPQRSREKHGPKRSGGDRRGAAGVGTAQSSQTIAAASVKFNWNINGARIRHQPSFNSSRGTRILRDKAAARTGEVRSSRLDMLATEPLRLLVGACFATCVAADAGDDFSNNLFSDLAPLLALFGERVTTQFMSQSMGWADNIIFAMAPLGIITAIVGAIRVGGPSWLKAIIGRARENRAVAESELMSSTSHEVCELWNGQQIVKVMGPTTMRERIFGPQQRQKTKKGPSEKEVKKEVQEVRPPNTVSQSQPTLQGNNSSNRVQQEQDDLEKGLQHPDTREICEDPNSGKSDKSYPSVVIIRNTDADTPNLTLNIRNQEGRGELYVCAAFGVVLQLGVLVYHGIAAKYLTGMLLKDENPVADYAFPCTSAGTLLLVAGMLICAHVVESSTSETRYRPADGMEARVVWLQRSETVNDQAFESFAVFPEDPQALVTTSHRASRRRLEDLWLTKSFGKAKDPEETTPEPEETSPEQPQKPPKKPSARLLEFEVEEVMAVTGTMLGICGFIVQFIGLRGMHWSASVAQLGATIVMTVLRASIRRNLAKNPKSHPLLSGHEIDWLAMTLGDPTNAPWRNRPECAGKCGNSCRPWADGNGWDWEIAAVEDPANREGLKRHPDTTGTKTAGSKESQEVKDNGNDGIVQMPDSPSQAQRVMKIRRSLGKLAKWHGPASAEAISLARAIEIAMDALLPNLVGTFTWSLEVSGESIHFRLKRGDKAWKAYADEIEAVLSLWLYSVDDKEQSQENRKQTEEEKENEIDDDAWLRAKGTSAKPGLRLLGSYEYDLRQDLRRWIPDDAVGVIEVGQHESTIDSSIIEVETHRIVGYASNWSSGSPTESPTRLYKAFPSFGDAPNHLADNEETANWISAVESYSPLKTLYAQHMFSAFMGAAAKMMEPIPGEADVRPAQRGGMNADMAWQSFELHNAQLSKMAQDIQSTGLGSLGDVYLSIIPPLSTAKKLPSADALIEWARERARPHEQLGHWEEAADEYLSLFQTAKTFKGQGGIATKATALLMENLRAVTEAIKLREAQQFEERDIQTLEQLKEKLKEELQSAGADILSALMGLYLAQGRSWQCPLVEIPKDLGDENSMLKFNGLHKTVARDHGNVEFTIGEKVKANSVGVNEKDILDWTPLHYAAAKPSLRALQGLLTYRADVKARDIRGWTPLHYACQHDNTSVVQNLLREGAEINMRDIDGITPLHISAIHGSRDVMRSLIEAGADINVVDSLGSTPLHWAAYKGRKALLKLLEDANMKLRDHNGRTVLHLAAITEEGAVVERKEVIRYLTEGVQADKEAKDRGGRTPLHLAARNGCEAIVKCLIEVGADKEAKESGGSTPLHLAARNGCEAIVKCLIEAGADKEAKESYGNMPLHLAARNGYEAIVKYLIEDAQVDKEAKDGLFGNTPLHLATLNGYEAIVKYLIGDAQADKEAKDGFFGYTTLHLATVNGHEAIVKYLIEDAQADKEARNRDGGTPLHLAAVNGREAIVKYLIEDAQADKEAKDQDGNTPLHYADSESQGLANRFSI